ncbi:MAG: hypothetical protein IEMM0002_1093 [bacterium]|nr:MAG: hypothetical protein IEMM0002_1093 [bacterium]
MKGMILAAGYGVRLRPETDKIPKPLFSIGKTNMIKNSIGFFQRHGVKEIAINIYHLGHMIKDELDSIPVGSVNIHLIEEKTLMGTAGGIKGAQPFLDGSEFAVINSDILTNLDLCAAIRFHRKKNALATLVVRENPDPARIGTLKQDRDERLVRFLASRSPEYDASKVSDSLKMFTGVHIFSPEIFKHIPAGRPVGISEETYPALIESGADIFAYDHYGYWADIGTPDSYDAAKLDVAYNRFKPYSI